MPKIGDIIYIFDSNRRVYPTSTNGCYSPGSAPIWIEHWRPVVIAGETSRSWLAYPGTRSEIKVPKKGGRGIAFSKEEVQNAAWVNEHQRRIIATLERVVRDSSPGAAEILLSNVARLVGYKETK